MSTEARVPLNSGLFSYTSGRFLYNEKLRLAERYVEFNVPALKQTVEQCLDHGLVSSLDLHAEGGFNRVFLLTMEDGFEVIVKIPYANAVPEHYATASEVATMKILLSKDIPVPRVYGWSSEATGNNVGVEYIIMDKAPGIGLDTKWFDMTKEQNRDLASSYVDIEVKLFSIPFGSYGSVYFKEDLPAHLQGPLYKEGSSDDAGDTERFCIGPSADYMFWYGRRTQLSTSRGPWKSASEYMLSVGSRELEWTRRFGKPMENKFPFNSLVEGEVDPTEYAKLLEKYLEVVPYLPRRDPEDPLNGPVLRHPDPTPRNVFISPETSKVTSLIDWQHTTVLPLLLNSGHPVLFENPDPVPPRGLKKPTLPENYGQLSSEEKTQADELYRRRILYHLYHVFTGVYNRLHKEALYEPFRQPRQYLVDRAGRQWSGNLVSLRGSLIHLVQNWHWLGHPKDVQCPIAFTDAEIEAHNEEESAWSDGVALENHWRQELGDMNEEGWIRTEMFDNAVIKNKELKQKWLDTAEDDEEEQRRVIEGWPYQDHEEVS